jgi:hypothetical protein
VLNRVDYEQWRQELLQAYESLSLFILQKSTHSELSFYRALFLWTHFLSVADDRNSVSQFLNACLSELVEIYREMLPKQRGQRPPSSFRMARMLNRRAAMGILERLRTRFGTEGWLKLGAG